MEETEKVLDMVFPAAHEPTGIVQPAEEAFNLPPTSGPAERAPVLRARPAPPVRGTAQGKWSCTPRLMDS